MARTDTTLRFDVYGRFVLQVERRQGQWIVHRAGNGLRRRERDLIIPAELDAADIASFLDDVYHELAGPGDRVVRLP